VMDYLLSVTTKMPPIDLGLDPIDDDLDLPTEAPDPEKPLFTNWDRIGIDVKDTHRAVRVALREGGSPLGAICAMLEGLRSHVGAHLDHLREQSRTNAQAIVALRREVAQLVDDDASADILDRLDAIEVALASPPGEAA
jgi:hypothetical protein